MSGEVFIRFSNGLCLFFQYPYFYSVLLYCVSAAQDRGQIANEIWQHLQLLDTFVVGNHCPTF